MARQELVGLLLGGQGLIEKSIDGMSDEQLSAVPEGMSNNILWNLGHLAHSLPEAFPDQFKGGSSPSTWEEAPSVSEVVESFKKLTPRVTDDLLAGKFDSYEAFDLMPGFTMGSIEQVLGFHLMHTGMHMHAIGAIKKALG
jgi:hypothetical protein